MTKKSVFARFAVAGAVFCVFSALVFAGCATSPGAAGSQGFAVGETRVMIGDQLAGIVNRPVGGGKAPAVLLLHSFASQKDEWGGLFKRFAASLSEKGIASLRFDYPDWGESKGDMADSTIDRWVADAREAYAFLARQSFVDSRRVGLLGFSVSGGIAIVTASQNPGWFKSMVTWSSPGDFKEMVGLLGQDNMDKAARDGKVDIDLQWTKFTLKNAFFKSLSAYNIKTSIKAYPGALARRCGEQGLLRSVRAGLCRQRQRQSEESAHRSRRGSYLPRDRRGSVDVSLGDL
jgi:dienelactone hydrolase